MAKGQTGHWNRVESTDTKYSQLIFDKRSKGSTIEKRLFSINGVGTTRYSRAKKRI